MIAGNKKLVFSIGFAALLLVAIPITVFLTQKKQETRSHASASTRMYLTPTSTADTPLQKNVGETVSYDVMIDPGTNLPSTVRLELDYDTTKLQASPSSVFAANQAAFPALMEGPIITNGAVLVSISIGSDLTKAIQTVTKVGTVTFTTIAPTTTASTITFGSRTQVLSVASTDQATENVLSTTTPGYVAIAGLPTATPVPTDTPAPTAVPTSTPNPTATDTPTLTPTTLPTAILTPSLAPTATNAPTPTINPLATTLSFTVFMHGIGNSGDNANPTASDLSNKNPLHPTRLFAVYIYDDANNLTASATATLVYNQAQGNFTGYVTVPDTFTPGQYLVKAQSPSHLRRLVPGILTINQKTNNVMPELTLVAGDINGDNVLNILDYNVLVGCYSDLLPAVSCTDTNKLLADLNDDGMINQVDYNLFIRELSVLNGN